MSSLAGQRRNPLQLAAALAIFAVAFFRLPYFFPVSPSVSASYVFQFNNRAAVFLFIAGATLFAIYSRGLSLQAATRDAKVSRTAVVLAIGGCVAVGAFVYWISIPFGLHGEMIYFYSRLDLLATGKTAYRDFEFAYGPLLLAPPLWIARVFHVSLVTGYVLYWLVDWAVGIWILYRLVDDIEIPSPFRSTIFCLLVLDLAGSIWPMGLNYAPVRTLASAGMAMLVFSTLRRGLGPATVVAVSVACAAVVAAISPEHGLAFMIGTGIFFVFCVRRRTSGYWVWIAILALCFLAIAAVSQRAGLYDTLRAFSSGGYNYPIMPTPDVLCVLALYLIAACVAYRMVGQKQTESLAVYLLCIGLIGLPSCFGRADSGHMQLGALSAIVIAALGLGRYPKTALFVAIAFVYLVVLAPFRGQASDIREQVERRAFDPQGRSELLHTALTSTFHLLHWDNHVRELEAKAIRNAQIDNDLSIPELPSGVVDAPFGLQRHGYTDHSGRVDYGYFKDLENVILPSQIDSILRWLQAHPERKVFLSRYGGRGCYDYKEGAYPGFQNIYGMHYASPKRTMNVFFPLCDYLSTHYAPDDVPFSYDMRLWHPVDTRIPEPTFTAH